MKKILPLLLALLAFTSCSTQLTTYGDEIGDMKSLDVIIFQTLNSTEALAMDKNHNVVKIVSNVETLYDGKKEVGYFVMIDTYTYETVPDGNGRTKIKTVPVYMRNSEYKAYKKGKQPSLPKKREQFE